ncbi:MAG: hypothetical protein BRC36_08695 [Cyanobacteria bacterium QH_2_48_84]|nr:MAG: hypothetical protein BRC36_08695 [Cyanobacteria bacterium QH_2_48_84]
MAGVLKVAIAESSYTLKQALQHYSGRDRASTVQVCGASKLGKQPKLINSQSSKDKLSERALEIFETGAKYNTTKLH